MVFVHYRADRVRLFIRIFFYVCSFGTTFFGGQSNKKAAQLAFIKNKRVPVAKTSGWFENFGLVNSFWTFKKAPGGLFAFICMIFATILGIVGDLAVTTFVVSTNVPERCSFNQGLVFQDNLTLYFNVTPVNGAPFPYLQQAQLTSLANGGLTGIYKKANNDTMFRADSSDLLGSWNCSQQDDVTYEAASSMDDIMHDLLDRGLLYYTILEHEISGNPSLWTHFVITSASTAGVGEAWELKAVVQTDSSKSADTIHMRPFNCSMNAQAAETMAYSMNVTETLSQWEPTIQGLMFDGTNTSINEDAGARLARLLNTMIMIQGGDNYLLATAPPDNTDQGCLKQLTRIPSGILALIGLEAGFALMLMILFCIDLMRLRSYGKVRRKVAELLPYYLDDWILHAIRERAQGADQDADASTLGKGRVKEWDLVQEDGESFPRLEMREPVQTQRLVGGHTETSSDLAVPTTQFIELTPMSEQALMFSETDQRFSNQSSTQIFEPVPSPPPGQHYPYYQY